MTTYVWPFCSPLSFLPILSIHDDTGPAFMGTVVHVDPSTGDLDASLPDTGSALAKRGGTDVGLGASMSDMPTSKLGLRVGGGTNALVGVVGFSLRTREARLCSRQLRLPAREREGAVAFVSPSSPSST